ncbi:hypothetical protein F8M41_023198 [Gigaspora margarita]|uniref:Uncharacterized protein n=1 Tax=Gigaspora margarita TaxID=4874 RepID=A0A8H4ADU8_GIGMA|nr:hypothetical protein F8M41_023198 [Gigaspora margarita]
MKSITKGLTLDIDHGTEIKKVSHKTSKQYRKLVELGYSNEMDEGYDTDWHCRSEIDEDLYKKRRNEEIKDKENDHNELMQKLLIVYNTISQNITQEREETPETDDASCGLNDEFDLKKEEEVETLLTESEEFGMMRPWRTTTRGRRKVEVPAGGTFDEIYEAGNEVEENEDKGVKVEIELLLTYSKFTEGDHTDIMENLRDYQTEIRAEKDIKKDKYGKPTRYQEAPKRKTTNRINGGEKNGNETVVDDDDEKRVEPIERRSLENRKKDQLKSVQVEEKVLLGNV